MNPVGRPRMRGAEGLSVAAGEGGGFNIVIGASTGTCRSLLSFALRQYCCGFPRWRSGGLSLSAVFLFLSFFLLYPWRLFLSTLFFSSIFSCLVPPCLFVATPPSLALPAAGCVRAPVLCLCDVAPPWLAAWGIPCNSIWQASLRPARCRWDGLGAQEGPAPLA